MSLQWGIHPPKFVGSQVYYRNIVTFCVEDDNVIGAKVWDLDGNSKITPYIDVPFDKRLSTEFAGVQNVDTSTLINSVVRTTWLFVTEEEAYVQKVMCLKKIKDYFYHSREEEKKHFDTKILSSIDGVYENIKNKHPEYFL